MVSDGVRLFIIGGDEIRAYEPIKDAPGYKQWAPGTRGIISPKALRGGKGRQSNGGAGNSLEDARCKEGLEAAQVALLPTISSTPWHEIALQFAETRRTGTPAAAIARFASAIENSRK